MEPEAFEKELLRRRTNFSYGKKADLDRKDRLILHALNKNARYSLAKLSKITKLSRDVIRYRIKRMIDLDVISGFMPVVNPPKMGFPIISYVLFSLYNINKKQEDEFMNNLMRDKRITYLATSSGKWDYIVYISAKDTIELNKIVKAIRHKFAEVIKDFEILIVLDEYKYEEYMGLVD
ncbi:MAG: Lrp/AsnC family transcriptional regulator [Candidatus Woesearchaeota archaeon]|nr:MAG: Lrp/AsnC family transcriptional regulator [Candidatus Woesearchaeota archaeon]